MSATGASVETTTVKVPGATLYVETRGSGPVLLLITGGPTDAGMFEDLAGRLADRYTVVSYDQRGHSRSTLDDGLEDIPVALHADDAAAVLANAGEQPAHVYGNSGGATIGLDLAARYPGEVGTLVAHEPPLVELVPDAEEWRSTFREIDDIYRSAGALAAMGRFGTAVEEGGPSYTEEMQQTPPPPEAQEMMARMMGNFDLFVGHEMQQIVAYVPDIAKLRSGPTRIVSAAGETSGEQMARRAAIALAERLGIDETYLPGAHGGWGSDPKEFADSLDRVLRPA